MQANETITMETGQVQGNFLHIREDRDKLCIPEGVQAKVYSGVTVRNCYIFGGYLETQSGATIRSCIINAGEACFFTGTKIGHLLAKEGCTLTLRTGVKVKVYKQTGPITFSMYPGNRLESPLKNKDAYAR